MHLDLVRAFLIVLEDGSLNRAALRRHVAQSSLTRQMQALEHEIGGPLLERTSTGVAPTAAGQALAERMRPLLADFDAAVAEARRLARGQRAALRIGYLPVLTRSFLNPALATLRSAHPEVKVDLLDLTPGEQIDALRRGEIDVAIVGQEGAVLAREFYTRRVMRLPVAVVVPASHRWAARERVELADLRNELFVGARESDVPGRNRWVTQLCRKAGFRPRFAFESESLSHAFSLVVSEGAVMLLPFHQETMPAAGVVLRRLADAGASWDFLVMWQRGRTAAPVRVLVDALARSAT